MNAPLKIRAVIIDGPADAETLELVRAAIASPSLSVVFAKVSVAEVIEAVSQRMGVSVAEIRARGNHRRGSRAMAAIAWLAMKVTARASGEIGHAVDRPGRAILYAVNRAEHLRTCDPAFEAVTNDLHEHFTGVRP